MMKNLILIFVLLPIACFAQKKVKQYAEVMITRISDHPGIGIADYVGSIGKPYVIKIDDGGGWVEIEKEGQIALFDRKITAINYLVQHGWTLEPIMEYRGEDGYDRNYHYFFSREIELTEGNKAKPLPQKEEKKQGAPDDMPRR